MCSSVTEEKGTWGPGITADFFCHSQMIVLAKDFSSQKFTYSNFSRYFAFDFLCTLGPLNAGNHRKCLVFPMEASAHSCLLLTIEVWCVIMQL